MASTRLGYLSLGVESTRGVPVATNKFVRFKEGDIDRNPEIIQNNPIQNNRRNAINAVRGKEATEGSYKVDVDPNELLFWLAPAMGQTASADISSLTDGTVWRHTLNPFCRIGSLSVEQAKGELCDDPLTQDGQRYQVSRAFGVMVDTLTLSGSDGILECEVGVKAFGVFNVAEMISPASVATYFFDTVEGLVAGDVVKMYERTGGTYENLTILSINQVAKSVTFTITPTNSANFTLAKETKMELLPKTPSYQAPIVFSFINVRYRFADTVTNAYLAEAENVENRSIEYMNNLEERYGSLRSSPSVIAEKGNGCMVKFEKYFETVVDRDRYLSQAPRACVIEMTNDQTISGTDTLATKYKISREFSEIIYTMYEMTTGTDEIYAISAEATAFYNDTDGRALRIIVENKNADTYYGI